MACCKTRELEPDTLRRAAQEVGGESEGGEEQAVGAGHLRLRLCAAYASGSSCS